jgi:hypothetical protein
MFVKSIATLPALAVSLSVLYCSLPSGFAERGIAPGSTVGLALIVLEPAGAPGLVVVVELVGAVALLFAVAVELVEVVPLVVVAAVETVGVEVAAEVEELVPSEPPQPASATTAAASASNENTRKRWADAGLAVESLTACSSVGWDRFTL